MSRRSWLGLLFALIFTVTVEVSATEQGTQNKDAPSSALIERLEGADLESLLDTRVALNPDWQVNTPTKLSQKSSRSPASVIVVSKEQISWFGYTSVAEVISHISGFSATDDLLQSSFGIRGIHAGARAGNRSFKVMLDDQPVNFKSNDRNVIDRNLIPISLIERIEIIKGPVSALYGANAFLGVINIVTKTSEEFIRKGSLVYLEAERIHDAGNGWFAEIAGGSRFNDWDSSFGLALGYADRGGLDLPLSSPDYALFAQGTGNRQLTSEDNISKPLTFYFKSRYLAKDASRWQVAAHYQELQSTHAYGDLNTLLATGNTHVDVYNAFLRLDHYRPLTEQLSLNLDMSVKKGAPRGDHRTELGSDVFYYRSNISYASVDVSAELNWQQGSSNHWLFGVDLSSDDHDIEAFSRVEKADGQVTPLTQPGSQTLNSQAYYLQWLAKWEVGFDTIFGYRHDHSEVYRSEDSIRLGLVYPLSDKHSLKLLYGSSFQAPSPELLYRRPIQRGDLIGNADLDPQQAKTIELVAAGTFGANIRYTATLYHSKVDDLVVYRDDVSNLAAVNAASARTKGLELDISYDTDNWHLYFNAGWQDIEVADSSLFVLENRPKGALFPEYTANAGLSYLWSNGIRLSLDNQFNDKRPASTSNVVAAETFYELDSYFDSTLTLQGNAKWFGNKTSVVKLQIHDLWGGKHSNPGFGGIDVPGLGLRYSLSFSQRF